MSGGSSSGSQRGAAPGGGQGGTGQPNGATVAPNGGAGPTPGLRAATGITKPEADVWYVNTDEAGDAMLGPLVVEGRLVDVDPAPGNAATWTEAGLYVPPAEALPEELLTEAEGDGRYTPLAHTTEPDPHPAYATDADLAALEGAAGAALAAHAAAPDPHAGYATDADLAAHAGAADAHGDYAAADHTHPSEESGPWRFQDTAGGAPGAGYLRTSSGALVGATQLIISRTTQDGYDIPPPGWGVVAGDTIHVQDRDDSTKWVRYEALEPLVRFPTYATGLVAETGHAGATIANGQIVQVTFSLAGGGGGGEGTAEVTITGDNGVGVTESPANTFALATRVSGSAGNQLVLQSGGLYVPDFVTESEGDARYLLQSDQGHNHTAAEPSGVLSNDEHDGYSQYTNLGADPTTPVANRIRLYSKDNGSGIATLYYRTESGDIYELPTLTTGGGGSGAPANASYVTTSAEGKLSGERVLGSAVIMSGLLSARPAFGTAGRLFLATDTDLVYRDTGAAWETFATRAAGGGGGGLATDPLADAKGDAFFASAADTVGRLAVGTNGQLLTADSTQTLGVRWATPSPTVTVAASAPGSPAVGDLWVW